VVIRVGLFFIAIAIFDIVYQKMNFAKEMKMEKFEVKQEYKDTEGDPHIKGKRKQMGQEIAYEEGNVNNVKKSKIFSKLVRLIQVEAKISNGDIHAGGLKAAMEKGPQGNMPKENIDRAIKKSLRGWRHERCYV